MIPTLRVLTKKSKLGFGKYKHQTVQFMLDNMRKQRLISPYFNLTSITYTEEILNELGITKEWRIEKPGSDKEMYAKFIKDKDLYKRVESFGSDYGSDKLRKLSKRPSKLYLQRKNQGH